MEHDETDWAQRWREGRTGFHLDEVHPLLRRHLDRLPAGGRVFVPLCGKSLDLAWLAAQGFRPCAVELSELAIQQLHQEAGVEARRERRGDFVVHRSSIGEVWQGDYFALPEAGFEPADALWDRGSLIAVAPRRRAEYGQVMRRLLRPGGRGLVVSVHYPPQEMKGPPHSVSEAELRAAFAPPIACRRLGVEDVLADHPRFVARGLSALEEAVDALDFPAEDGL